jgi:uncharacterized integral membrane protein
MPDKPHGNGNVSHDTPLGEPRRAKLMSFSKSASIWVFVAVGAIAFLLLLIVYMQGGLPHAVHQ